MGRGGGRHRGGGGRRGGHGHGGRGRGSNFRRGGGAFQAVSRKDAAHLSQFGEKHPSQELGDFGPSAPAKRGKFEGRGRGRGNAGRGRGGRGNWFGGGGENQAADDDNSSSSEEDEEETTPYNELLSVFTGKKQDKNVQIVSESDEDDDEEEEVNESENENSRDNEEELDGEESEEDKGNSSENDIELKDDEQSLSGSEDEDGENNQRLKKDSKSREKMEQDEAGDGADSEPEDTVIEDAELDPEFNENVEKLEDSNVDPFLKHFECEMSEELQREVKKEKPSKRTQTLEWPIIEKFTFIGLDFKQDFSSSNDSLLDKKNGSIDLSELDKLPQVKLPEAPTKAQRNPSLTSLYIKSQLHSTLPLVNQASIDKAGSPEPLTRLQMELIDLASRYHDLYFPLRTINNADEIRLAYCLHAANHVLKTRTRILHHNAKMANKSEVPDAYRDQGFVRPKVLILAPFKESALRIVQTLISLILKEEKGNVANKKRFTEEYGGQTLFMPKTNPKPEDYMATFSGNVEDNFKIGMAVTKKSVKLYTGFYSSDIIVASPLGLRMIIGAEGEKDRDYDFLSSIEVLIMDQADVFLMQNWDHLLHIMKHLHLQPVTTHGTDFARIRPWALDGLSKYYCQTMIFSSVACPEHSSLLSKYGGNYAGQVRVIQNHVKGSICHVTVQLPQVFQKFDVSSIQDVDEERFKYFTKHVLPNFKEKLMSHTLIFVSSYFDFVKLRNYFRREETSFVQICEYTKDKKIARARDLFFHGTNHFLLYTERSHFFRRFRLKGIGHIIFYQLPQNPQFYPELCNLIQESFQNRKVRQRKNSSVNVLYCKYDTPRLAAIVGNDRAGHMLNSEKNTHAFVSGGDL